MSNAEKHWEKTRSLLFVTLAIWFVFSIGIFLFAAEMNEVTGPFGYPWTYWFTCQGSLGIFVILFSGLRIGKKKSMKNSASTKERIAND